MSIIVNKLDIQQLNNGINISESVKNIPYVKPTMFFSEQTDNSRKQIKELSQNIPYVKPGLITPEQHERMTKHIQELSEMIVKQPIVRRESDDEYMERVNAQRAEPVTKTARATNKKARKTRRSKK